MGQLDYLSALRGFGGNYANEDPADATQIAQPMGWGSGLSGGLVNSPIMSNASTAAASPDFMSSLGSFGKWLTGGVNPDGSRTNSGGGLLLGAANGLMNGWLGMQQYGLAKQTLAENQRQYDQNYAAQRQTVNSQLEDRQAARVASNPAAYQSVGDYMNKNRVL